MCGAVAGSVAKTIIAPAERVKMHFQISSDKFTARAALQRGLNMIKDEGVISLWYGHSTTLIRVAPYAGLQFAVHDHMEIFKHIAKYRICTLDAAMCDVCRCLK